MKLTTAQVEAFLRGLRAKNGKDRASRRTWEIHRGALHGFFSWAATADADSNRPFTFSNPVDGIRKFTARKAVLLPEPKKPNRRTSAPSDRNHPSC